MSRIIIKYAYPITIVILLIFAIVVYQRLTKGWNNIEVLAIAAGVIFVLVVPLFLVLWPRITVTGFKRVILRRGMGDGPIPVNSLYAVPTRSSASASNSSLLGTGTDDVLYVVGWIDVAHSPLVLSVPDAHGRYYSLQFTDPVDGSNFAYVGKRTTGTAAGRFLLTGPRWTGSVPTEMNRIVIPRGSALVIGRVFVDGEPDHAAAFEVASQLGLSPLG
jgi:hypothetical protein